MNVTVDFKKTTGEIKRMHCANNAPPFSKDSKNRAFDDFKALEIPFVRNHDASLSELYGCQHVVDVHCIFPDFSRDVNDADAYDFTLTDEYIKNITDMGSGVFYRLGAGIEHWSKKYGTAVPVDFKKWAEVCEHIILHYNNGWADGFRYGIVYWEIWNEPDLDTARHPTWSGTKEQFFDFYETVAKHLKTKFPGLKIGGPALAWNYHWLDDMLEQMQKRNVPIDFISWHMYQSIPDKFIEHGKKVKAVLEKHGYGNCESILDEWNYVDNWDNHDSTAKLIPSIAGAVFIMSVMCAVQNSDVADMMMYYDFRYPTSWNAVFDIYTCKPIKGYYVFEMFRELYRLKTQVECISDDNDIKVLSASDGKVAETVLSYFSDSESADEKEVNITFNESAENTVYLLNADKNNEQVFAFYGDRLQITVTPNTVVRIRSKRGY